MFKVLGGTEEVCHKQQCLLANCSTTEHQQWRSKHYNVNINQLIVELVSLVIMVAVVFGGLFLRYFVRLYDWM